MQALTRSAGSRRGPGAVDSRVRDKAEHIERTAHVVRLSDLKQYDDLKVRSLLYCAGARVISVRFGDETTAYVKLRDATFVPAAMSLHGTVVEGSRRVQLRRLMKARYTRELAHRQAQWAVARQLERQTRALALVPHADYAGAAPVPFLSSPPARAPAPPA